MQRSANTYTKNRLGTGQRHGILSQGSEFRGVMDDSEFCETVNEFNAEAEGGYAEIGSDRKTQPSEKIAAAVRSHTWCLGLQNKSKSTPARICESTASQMVWAHFLI